ncbi:MAG: sigma-70 family RNA polymerase sigma factor [Bacilli bacterium]
MNSFKEEYGNDSELLYLISERSEEADEIIFKKYSPIIDLKVKKYLSLVLNKGYEYGDLYQEGLLGLNSAVRDFKEQKDIKFSTFATLCIERKICSAVRKATRKKHSVLNESFSLDYKTDDDSKSLIDNIMLESGESVEDLIISREQEALLKELLNKELTDYENTVYELRMNNFTYTEIAQTLGKSYKSIESALFRIKVKIKNIMAKIN